MPEDCDRAVEDKKIMRLKEQQMTSQYFKKHKTKSLTPAAKEIDELDF